MFHQNQTDEYWNDTQPTTASTSFEVVFLLCIPSRTMSSLALVVKVITIYASLSLFLLIVITRIFAVLKRLTLCPSNRKTIAFIHPYCAGGGGGERVLWDAISAMMQQKDKLKFHQIVIYSANTKPSTLTSVLKKVESRFDITMSPSIIHLPHCYSNHYPQLFLHWKDYLNFQLIFLSIPQVQSFIYSF